jgi:beta-mannosidase
LNTTQVFAANTSSLPFSLKDAVLKMNITASGSLPNSDDVAMFEHEYYFHDIYLNQVKLVDPALTLYYDKKLGIFLVEATEGVAAWVWLDMPAGTLGNFAANGFWLVPGDGPREIGANIKNDTSGGSWVEEVTVRSLWNNTLA